MKPGKKEGTGQTETAGQTTVAASWGGGGGPSCCSKGLDLTQLCSGTVEAACIRLPAVVRCSQLAANSAKSCHTLAVHL